MISDSVLIYTTLKFTQAELGKLVGVRRQAIIAIDRGRCSLSLETAFRITQVLKVNLAGVFLWPSPLAFIVQGATNSAPSPGLYNISRHAYHYRQP